VHCSSFVFGAAKRGDTVQQGDTDGDNEQGLVLVVVVFARTKEEDKIDLKLL